ncbi:MAG: tRNA-dihydrouridine synthase [Acidobacteriota bacterium]
MPDEFFLSPYTLGRKQVRGRFVIPSGIRCTHASTIAKCFAEVPALGVITTKSISVAPRAGYREPIYARYAPGCYINAVGLTNPGAEAFRDELAGIEIPADKFLLVSVFGADLRDYVRAAEILEPIADGFELNMSCPHAKGYGIQIGEDEELVVAITRAVAAVKAVPVFIKLSATMHGLSSTAQAAIRAGAAGITLTNTIGPALAAVGVDPILHNRYGGISGDAIRPLGLRSVEQVRQAIGAGPVIIGMGGIASAEHVAQFRNAGADLFGVGSALTGMDSPALGAYFAALQDQCCRDFSLGQVAAPLPDIDMSYCSSRLVSRTLLAPGLFKIHFDKLPQDYRRGELAGKYFFLFAPGVGEKPFAILSATDRSVLVRTVGRFSGFLEQAPLGAVVLLRGPYGAGLPRFDNRTLVLIGGGTGTASLLEIAYACRATNQLKFLLGARTRDGFFDLDEFRRLGTVLLSTDDGSAGYHGTVADLLRGEITAPQHQLTFINCGPEAMVHACFEIERRLAAPEHIWGAIEYITSCGVGICGKCASPSGSLSCIDGPFLPCTEFRACARAPGSIH